MRGYLKEKDKLQLRRLLPLTNTTSTLLPSGFLRGNITATGSSSLGNSTTNFCPSQRETLAGSAIAILNRPLPA
ncbi:unnamed protein product [Leuciscus chuanchicus]